MFTICSEGSVFSQTAPHGQTTTITSREIGYPKTPAGCRLECARHLRVTRGTRSLSRSLAALAAHFWTRAVRRGTSAAMTETPSPLPSVTSRVSLSPVQRPRVHLDGILVSPPVSTQNVHVSLAPVPACRAHNGSVLGSVPTTTTPSRAPVPARSPAGARDRTSPPVATSRTRPRSRRRFRFGFRCGLYAFDGELGRLRAPRRTIRVARLEDDPFAEELRDRVHGREIFSRGWSNRRRAL